MAPHLHAFRPKSRHGVCGRVRADAKVENQIEFVQRWDVTPSRNRRSSARVSIRTDVVTKGFSAMPCSTAEAERTMG
jgi:hypothetical protein